MVAAFLVLATSARLTPLTPAPRVGQTFEWRVEGLVAPTRPYEVGAGPTAKVQTPDGRSSRVAAFWYVPHRRETLDGKERFVPTGPGEWRLRYTPTRPGRHEIVLEAPGAAKASVGVAPGKLQGFVRRSRSNPGYLQYLDGSKFIPIGMNVCWWNEGGTQDYERWASRIRAAGMNYARLWMSPWAFGIEANPGALGAYSQDQAFALDHVLEVFRKEGIQVALCLDYHGMLQTQKDYWGSNDNWTKNPYNAALGGPAKTPNDFFADPEARRLYRQRLRYIVARYASYPNVAVWEFWNEVDNVRSNFRDSDMLAWHAEMAREVRALDPYGRLVSTSLTHDTIPEIWKDMDLVQSHSYGQANPGIDFGLRAKRFRRDFGKPHLVGEYGVDFRAPKVEDDPRGRGLKQAIWGSLLGGGAGCAQSWWWETLDANNAYPAFASLAKFVRQTGIGARGWASLDTVGTEEMAELPALKGGDFDVRVPLVSAWGARNRGFLLLTDPAGAGGQARHLGGYLHGTSKPEMRMPFRLEGYFGPGAEVRVHVNSVSDLAILRFLVDGKPVFEKAFPDKDGKYEVNGEYGETVSVKVSEGRRSIELQNVGRDWAVLDWLEVEGALRTQPLGGEAPPVEGVASGTGEEAVVWVCDPRYAYPNNAKQAKAEPVSGAWLELRGMRAGAYRVRWWDTSEGVWRSEQRTRADASGRLNLSVPSFREDIAARIVRTGT